MSSTELPPTTPSTISGLPALAGSSIRALAICCVLWAATPTAALVCRDEPVLTPLATDTRTQRSLYSLRSGSLPGASDWLVELDAATLAARLFPAPRAHLRTGASHGGGPFLSAERCGDDCFQPLRWTGGEWRALGFPIEHDPSANLHFTYDRSGSPWLVFHRSGPGKGLVDATAYRWTGETWEARGRLLVQAVGSPGATADPNSSKAILTGSGRFAVDTAPDYWLPALPTPPGAPGGQVLALSDGAAAYLTFDSRVLISLDGAAWRLERWTPWPNPLGRTDLWRSGLDYTVDRPIGGPPSVLPLLWFDDRQHEHPALHLTQWRRGPGWQPGPKLNLPALAAGSIEHAVYLEGGGWLLVGPCRSSGSSDWLESLLLEPGSHSPRVLQIELAKDGGD